MKTLIIVLLFILVTSIGFANLNVTLYDPGFVLYDNDHHHHNDNPYTDSVDRITNNPNLSYVGKIVSLSVLVIVFSIILIRMY